MERNGIETLRRPLLQLVLQLAPARLKKRDSFDDRLARVTAHNCSFMSFMFLQDHTTGMRILEYWPTKDRQFKAPGGLNLDGAPHRVNGIGLHGSGACRSSHRLPTHASSDACCAFLYA